MASTATVTGIVGPGQALTSSVFSNVTWFALDTVNEMLDIMYDNGNGAKRTQISVGAAATWTLTVSGNNYTLTVAN